MVECPYCETEQEVDYDDGAGYAESVLHQMECSNCEKTFVFNTSILFHHNGFKADCLNGGQHKYKPTITYPNQFTQMECTDCGLKRNPTDEEWLVINKKLILD